ncbi:YceI family protein [uncultured Friedmanniella sp.]|uniref:YceI family protein n=1 Tax=uncultured Friedmanniella sp. TaxID=335381 RepID=UPI0035CA4E38
MTQEVLGSGLVAGTWTIDPAHSTVGFTVRHLMSKVRGTFTDFTGEITTTDDPTASVVKVAITSASINTNNAQRDGHLQSTDFFDAEAGQQLVFESTGVRESGDGHIIDGTLTINGQSHPVELATEFLGVATDAYGLTRLGAEATTSISRKQFGVDFNVPLEGGKLLIGDKIDISLEIEAILG